MQLEVFHRFSASCPPSLPSTSVLPYRPNETWNCYLSQLLSEPVRLQHLHITTEHEWFFVVERDSRKQHRQKQQVGRSTNDAGSVVSVPQLARDIIMPLQINNYIIVFSEVCFAICIVSIVLYYCYLLALSAYDCLIFTTLFVKYCVNNDTPV